MDQSLLARLASQREVIKQALRVQGRSIVYAYLREKDSPRGKAGSPYYIGVAGYAARPYEAHRQIAVPKDKHRVRVLRADVTREQACAWETYYIQRLGRADTKAGRQLLHNRTDGGEGAINPSEEVRSRIGAASKGRVVSEETRAKIGAANRDPSAETRAKISAASRAKSPEARARIGSASRARAAEIAAHNRSRPQDARARQGAAKTRTAALRLGVDPEVYAKLTRRQRASAAHRAKQQGITISQYIEKMHERWGLGTSAISTQGSSHRLIA